MILSSTGVRLKGMLRTNAASSVNCSRLQWLFLMHNQFKGMLPNVLGNLSTQLKYFMINNNLIFGQIPSGIGNLISMIHLWMHGNKFTGTIPSDIGNLQNLAWLALWSCRRNNGTLTRPSLSCNWSGTFFLALGFNATCLAIRKAHKVLQWKEELFGLLYKHGYGLLRSILRVVIF
ncbi:receptor-like protein 53 [Quercus suber]|uniref:Receptor-like protein 53 n=1 Tax=Quercus suber TaxID=58331 RepID=A0AAW0L4F4_QUESU